MIYDYFGGIRYPLKQGLTLEFRNKYKVTSILTQTHINHDQIRHIRNNWLDPTFLSLGDCWFCLIWVFEVSLRLTLILKGDLCLLRLLPVMIELSVVMPLQGVAPGNSWLGGCFFEEQNYMKNKNEGNGNKIILGDFNCTVDKMDRDGENETEILCRCSSNYFLSKLLLDNELEDLWRRENPLSPKLTR